MEHALTRISRHTNAFKLLSNWDGIEVLGLLLTSIGHLSNSCCFHFSKNDFGLGLRIGRFLHHLGADLSTFDINLILSLLFNHFGLILVLNLDDFGAGIHFGFGLLVNFFLNVRRRTHLEDAHRLQVATDVHKF